MLPVILLVDDDSTTNFLNQRLLGNLRVSREVREALNGAEALALLQACCREAPDTFPALILLDLNMPVMDGFEFLEAYQQLPPGPRQHTIVVVLTTSRNPKDVERAQGLPISSYLTKPLTRDKISQLLLEHFPATPALPATP